MLIRFMLHGTKRQMLQNMFCFVKRLAQISGRKCYLLILPERALLSGIAVNDDKTGVILQWEKYEDGRSEKRKGNCYSAGQVMARIYQAMGYKATVRSAIHDKKSRYPSNMIMGSDHYNVEVIMNGRTYYLDATPGCGGVYLSSPKEVLESYIYGGDGWERIQ